MLGIKRNPIASVSAMYDSFRSWLSLGSGIATAEAYVAFIGVRNCAGEEAIESGFYIS